MEILLSLLTFNIWDLPVWVPNLSRRHRLPGIPGRLAELDPDLCFLQECFSPGTRKDFSAKLSETYNMTGSGEPRWFLPFVKTDSTGGLLLLSRLPIQSTVFVAHPRGREMRYDERLGQKGFLVSTLATDLGPVCVVNVHLYAGRKTSDTAHRLNQIDTMLDWCDSNLSGEWPLILAGDFNASPTIPFPASGRFDFGPEYERLRAAGFTDCHPVYDETAITYAVPGNKYAEMWYQGSKTSQRFSYVFYRFSGDMMIEPVSSEIIFNRGEPLSDHYGLLCKVKLVAPD